MQCLYCEINIQHSIINIQSKTIQNENEKGYLNRSVFISLGKNKTYKYQKTQIKTLFE